LCRIATMDNKDAGLQDGAHVWSHS
jgi:hypothetical protein